MRIDSLELHNFISHADTRVEFNGTRLAAFTGENGAGKSSLLEAIKFILYDSARLKTDGLVRIGSTDMSAALVFEFAGATYRAVRGRTTKAGGKSFLELHLQLPDGSWAPLTGDDIRSTQAAIASLLGLDADAFATAVFIGQGDVGHFVEATAGERKRILSTVLGLDVYGRAEAEARSRATRLDGEIAGARAERDRIDARLAERGDVLLALAAAEAAVEERATELAALELSRDEAAERLVALAGEIVAAEAATAEVARLDGELVDLRARWTAAAARRTEAEAAIARAAALLADADDVAAAAARLPECQAQVDRLVVLERTGREADAEIRRRRDALTAQTGAFDREAAAAAANLANARHRVEELLAGVNALEPIVCPKCGNGIVVDQAGLGVALSAAKVRVHELEAAIVEEPLSVGIERSKIERLESKRRDLGFDPAALVAAHRALTDVSAQAARSEAIAGARDARDGAVRTGVDANTEIVELDARGKVARETRDAAAAKAADAQRLLDVQAELRGTVAGHERTIASTREWLTGAERVASKIQGQLDALDALEAQRETVATGIATAEVDLARLRRLVAAFGVTGIPARIIESVLPELAGYANDLLGELRPGMVVELAAQRAKRDGKGIVEALDVIVRDDVGERPIEAYSGGETTSICLAIAIGLSRLGARRSGARIESLIVDEPDGLDEPSRRAFGQSLRALAHRGELSRIFWISHHPDLTDYADQVWAVRKTGSGSVVEQAI